MALTEIDLNVQAKDHTLIPSKISNNPVDNFTFPNNVIVSGQLQTPSIADLSAILVVDVTNRYLKDSSNVISLDWLNRLLKASDGSTSINFGVPGTVDVNTILDVTGHSIIHVADPVNANDAANKTYVDTVAQGLLTKAACTAATTGALVPVTAAGSGVGKTLTENANGLLSVDGVSTWVDVVNDGGSTNPSASNPASRVLVKNQANQVDNGIYCVTNKGSGATPFVLTRAIDFDGSPANEVQPGDFTFVGEGTVNASSGWTVSGTNNPVVVDTNPIPFIQFSGAGQIIAGQGLTKTGNELDVHPLDASLLTHVGDISVQRDPAGAVGLSGSGVVINVDNSTIDISANNIEVKTGGITNTQVSATAAIASTKLQAAGSNQQIQFNSSGTFGASSKLTWDGNTVNLTTAGSGLIQIGAFGDPELGITSGSSGFTPEIFLFRSDLSKNTTFQQDTSANLQLSLSGTVGLQIDQTTTNVTLPNAGNLTMTTAAQNVAGGSLTLTTIGATGNNNTTGGSITVTTGNDTSFPGGTHVGGGITITTGNNLNGVTTGGGLTITTGTVENNVSGGSILLSTGSCSGSGADTLSGGSITLTTGNGTGSNILAGGGITLTTGTGGATRTGGNITLTAGTPANGGNLSLTGTGASHGTITAGGNMAIDGSTFNVDAVNHRVGINTASPVAGYVMEVNGQSLHDDQISIIRTGGTGLLVTGAQFSGLTGPAVTVSSGDSGSFGGTTSGGAVTLTSGNGGGASSHLNGANLTLTTGTLQGDNGFATGGSITLTTGNETGGGGGGTMVGGGITLTTGSSGTGGTVAGGNITLTANVPANGGSIVLSGTGANGTSGSPLHGNIYGNNANWVNEFVSGTITTNSITGNGAAALNIVTPTVNNNATSLNVTAGGVMSGVFTAGSLNLAGGAGVGGGLGASLTLKGWIGFPYGNADAILSSGGLSSNGGNVIFQYAGTEIARMTSSLNMGIGNASPAASALLDLTSTTRGFLPPRMTTTQKNAISSPATGLIVYDTTLNLLQEWNGTSWGTVSPSPVIVISVSTTTVLSSSTTQLQNVLADATGGAFSVTLPSAATANQQITIKKIDSSANTVTIQANGSELIDGSNTQSLIAQWQSLTMISNGTSWFLI